MHIKTEGKTAGGKTHNILYLHCSVEEVWLRQFSLQCCNVQEKFTVNLNN